nr:ORF1 [Tick-associated anellovirus 10]
MYFRRRPYRRRRNFLHHRRRRWFRRHWRRAHRRRGWYRRRRVRNIRQLQPRRKRLLVVTGWEILGQVGSQIKYVVNEKKDGSQSEPEARIDILNPIPMNKQVKYLSLMIPQGLANTCQDKWTENMKKWDYDQKSEQPYYLGPNHWDFCGGWGYAKFDFQSLILRNLLGMNRFSEDITNFTHIRWLKFKFQLIRGPSVDYLFRIQMHRGPQDFESPLVHPAHLLNMPFVTWVESIARSKCCRKKVLRRLATTDLSGWYDIESFRNQELVSYQWSAFDPNNPLGKNPDLPGAKTDKFKWWDDGWMRIRAATTNDATAQKPIKTNRDLNWQDRTTYDNTFVQELDKKVNNYQQSWFQNIWDWVYSYTKDDYTNQKLGKNTPFCPPVLPSTYVNTLWFRYKFYFQVGGATIGRYAPEWPLRETHDNTAKVCRIPGCKYCIKEGDLDKDGVLTEEAYERITEPPERGKKTLVEKLARALQRRRKRKRERKITWWDEKEEEPGTAHSHSKNGKAERIRYLAARLGL